MNSQELFIGINLKISKTILEVTQETNTESFLKEKATVALSTMLNPVDKFLTLNLNEIQKIMYLNVILRHTNEICERIESSKNAGSNKRTWNAHSHIRVEQEIGAITSYIENSLLKPLSQELESLETIFWPRVEKFILTNSLVSPVDAIEAPSSVNKI